jgi:predicted ABC-type ATPase
MASAVAPSLHLVVGPNGAGKTTLYETQIRRLTDAEFVNADQLALSRFGRAATTREESEAGQRLADACRRFLMEARQSFVAESTFSHPSKLDLLAEARTAGYRIIVYHVNVRGPDRSVARVAARVEHGGHPVPEDRIRARYVRNQPLIRQAVLMADRAFVFDNSALGKPPRLLIRFQAGVAWRIADSLPSWAASLYGDSLR